MLLIRTRIGPSAIHGNGVFACEAVRPGQIVWRFQAEFDRVISDDELAAQPDAFRQYVDMYAYRSTDLGGSLVLSCDHAKFLNHSDDPNTEEQPFISVARRSINIGDEMTCNYGSFCVDWRGFGSD
jgi:SET domain-containing protein